MSEGSNENVHMHRLIWNFAAREEYMVTENY